MRVRTFTLAGLLILATPAFGGTDSLSDVFPLARGNTWTYSYSRFNYAGAGGWGTDTGFVEYRIVAATESPDSILWHVVANRAVAYSAYYAESIGSTLNDTLHFDIIELKSGAHLLYTLPNYQKEAFSFTRTDVDTSWLFHRYQQTTNESATWHRPSTTPYENGYEFWMTLRDSVGPLTCTGSTVNQFPGWKKSYSLTAFSRSQYPGAKLVLPSRISFIAAVGAPRDTSILISNVGIDTLQIAGVTSSDSSLLARVSPAVIPPFTGAMLTFHYLATQVKVTSGRITIVSNGVSSPDTIAVDVNNQQQTTLSLSWRSFDFGDVDAISRNFDVDLSVTNTGALPLFFDSIKTTDGEFSVIPRTQPIAPGKTGTWIVRFTAVPPFDAYLRTIMLIYSNSLSSPDTITAQAHTHGSQFSFTPALLDFGNVVVGSSASLALKISFSGYATINLFQNGPDDTQFAAHLPFNSCHLCTPAPLIVKFTPSLEGTASSYIAFTSKNGSILGLDTIRLQGTGGLVSSFALLQNYPNPFNLGTTIPYEITGLTHTTLTVYDLLGREVAVLVDEPKQRGHYEVKFDGGNRASGVYFYKLQAGTFISTRKLLLIK